MYYPCSEIKALISFAVTAKLICVFVFAYADCWFSHEAAHLFIYLFIYLFTEAIGKRCAMSTYKRAMFTPQE